MRTAPRPKTQNVRNTSCTAPKYRPSPRALECPVQMEATVEAIHPFGRTNPMVPTDVVAVEVRVVAVHASPKILRPGEATDRIDPDRWRPLIMSFRELYGLGDAVVPSRLAEGTEELWRPGGG